MHMKLIAHILLIVFCGIVHANDCIEPISTVSETVKIYPDVDPDSGMYHIRAPQKVDGLELNLLVLSATFKGADSGKEISIPLAIKTKDEVTGSYFHMPTNWLNLRVAASYGENLCRELVANYSM